MRRRRLAVIGLFCAACVLAAAAVARMPATPSVRTLVTASGVAGIAADAASGHVAVALVDQGTARIALYDEATGRLVRSISAPDTYPALADLPASGRFAVLLTGSSSTRVAFLDARTGHAMHAASIPGGPAISGSPSVSGNHVFVASTGGPSCPGSGCSSVTVFDAASGRTVRIIHVSGYAMGTGLDTQARRLLVLINPPTRRPPLVRLFDAASGQLVRQTSLVMPPGWPLPIEVLPAPAIDSDVHRAYIPFTTPLLSVRAAAPLGGIAVLDTRRGTQMRTIALPGLVTGIAVDRRAGRVFASVEGPARVVTRIVGNPGGGSGVSMLMPLGRGWVYVLNARRGAVIRRVSVGIAPRGIAVDERRGRVYVANAGGHDGYGLIGTTGVVLPSPVHGPGSLSVLDAASGRLLRTVPLGIAPFSVAVDPATGRVVIGDNGDPVPRTPPDPWGWLPSPLRRRIPLLPRPPAGGRTQPGGVLIVDALG